MKSFSNPGPWNWLDELRPRRLFEWFTAPDEFGFYEIGFLAGDFEAMYGGRAAGTKLRQRLRAHFFHSHNDNIRLHRHNAWFRYKVFRSKSEAKFVEAIHIVAMEYKWNDRMEWSAQWLFEQ